MEISLSAFYPKAYNKPTHHQIAFKPDSTGGRHCQDRQHSGKFECIALLGRWGMGKAYEAEDQRLVRDVLI
jgi:hypothetical protein